MILGLYNSFLNNIEDIIDVVSIARIIPKDNPKNIAKTGSMPVRNLGPKDPPAHHIPKAL